MSKASLLVHCSGVEFWTADKTIKVLAEGNYFRGGWTASKDCDDDQLTWPSTLQAMLG